MLEFMVGITLAVSVFIVSFIFYIASVLGDIKTYSLISSANIVDLRHDLKKMLNEMDIHNKKGV